jgi:hypothetical protein
MFLFFPDVEILDNGVFQVQQQLRVDTQREAAYGIAHCRGFLTFVRNDALPERSK